MTKLITAVGDETVCTSIVVACELHYGAVKKGAPILVRKVERLLDSIEVLHTLSLGLTLVTDNLSEFSRVPDLTVENWLAGPDPA